MEIKAVLDTNVVLAAEGSSNSNSPNREIIRRWLAAEIRFFHLRHYPADPDDVLYLLCAINGEATHLVSYDPHLLELSSFYDDFVICPPLEFLKALREEGGRPSR